MEEKYLIDVGEKYAVRISSTKPKYKRYTEYSVEKLNGLHTHELCWENGNLINNPLTLSERKREIEINVEISALKSNLANTDYQAIKYAEGELSAEEYQYTKAQRKEWRAKINELEAELKFF